MIITNLNFISISDGYYFISNLLGIYNIRYRGYYSIFTLFKINKKWNKDYCGFLILLGIITSFTYFYKMMVYYAEIFNINRIFTQLISLIIIIIVIIRFIKIKRINSYFKN